jgi:predicted NBD/HSP70 family sugar kinase
MKVLVIDVGGTSIKVLSTGHRTPLKIPSGPKMTPGQMVSVVLNAVEGWDYSAVSIGYPGPVKNGRPTKNPVHLGRGWVGFDFAKAFRRPVKVINDAAMQAVGSCKGGRMLFLGLGTGLGTTLIVAGVVAPMELAHLPYKKGRTYEEYVGKEALDRLGKKKWRRSVADVTARLAAALEADDVVIGGGNRLWRTS